ncbi:MAG: hypothetical protein BWY71_01868 [Planctomycetes bacterium ADurb.Bin412]|nr:MAG: hypothetical protein BWY71_01868 [Planctomycetes bacterium ADurb.Bin412]
MGLSLISRPLRSLPPTVTWLSPATPRTCRRNSRVSISWATIAANWPTAGKTFNSSTKTATWLMKSVIMTEAHGRIMPTATAPAWNYAIRGPIIPNRRPGPPAAKAVGIRGKPIPTAVPPPRDSARRNGTNIFSACSTAGRFCWTISASSKTPRARLLR